MAFHTIKGFLSSAVPTGLTFQSSYPSGTTQDSYVGQAAAELVMNQAEMSLQDGGFSVSLGALSITLTNLTGRTWPIGSEFYLQLDEPVTEFGLLEDELASGKQSIKLPEGRFGISGFNQFVQIEGAGQGSTIIEVSGTGAISLASRGAGLSNLTLRRASGGSANAILTSPVAGFSSWFDGVELFRTRISNSNGTAIEQFSGVSHMLLIDDSITGIRMNYGGVHHEADIKVTKWPVKYSQSIAVQQSDSPMSGVYAKFKDCLLQYTHATEGWGIEGLLENANGDHTSAEIIGNGPSYATWWATQLTGCDIRGACVPVGSPAATTPAIRGFIQGKGGIEITADRITDKLRSSYIISNFLSCQNPDTDYILNDAFLCVFKSQAFIHSNTKQVVFSNRTYFRDMELENDAIKWFGRAQAQCINCTDLNGKFGADRRDVALRHIKSSLAVSGTPSALRDIAPAENFVEVLPTKAFNLATCTVEAWVRFDADSGQSGLFCSVSTVGTRTGFYLFGDRATNTISGGFNTGTVGSVLSYSNAASFAPGEHHFAICQAAAGQQRLWIDGVERANIAAATPTDVARRFILGGLSDDPTTGQSLGFKLGGQIRNIRVSNVQRYLTGTSYAAVLPQRFTPDANTVGLWQLAGELQIVAGEEGRILLWPDEMGLYDGIVHGQPSWVGNNYSWEA